MQNLVKFLVTALVDHPDQVAVDETTDDTNLITVNVSVADEDMGKIIGKGGKIISAIRTLAKVKGVKTGQKVKVILTEPQTDQYFPSAPPAEPSQS